MGLNEAFRPASDHGAKVSSTIKIERDTAVLVDHTNNLGWTVLRDVIELEDRGAKQIEAVRLLLEGGADDSVQ